MLGCDDATLRYLSDRKRFLGIKNRGRLTVISILHDMKHASLDVVLSPTKTRIPSTYKTSVRTSNRTQPALMVLEGKTGNYSENLTEHTNTPGGGAHSQPARKNALLRVRQMSMRKLLLVTPTNRSPLLCPRVNVLPHRTKTLPHCTRIFSWSVDSTYGEL
jgi:hypothetical protein